MNPNPSRWRKNVAAFSLVAAGLVGGGVATSALTANAADSSTSTSTTAPATPGQDTDQSKPQRSDEQLLTGSNATKATAAALAKYPGATIERVETDSGDAEYEAHIVTADGERLTVLMDKSFTVTGTDTHGGGRSGAGA